jgi:uncharacterized protein YuzE
MVQTDAIEGTINQGLWFHYDLAADVLYLRLASCRDEATVAEETPDGLLLIRRQTDDQLVGLTIVNWWKRFGRGTLPDSIRELEVHIEPWAGRVAA